MSEKSLKDKAIKIQGKSYVLVSDRVSYFNEAYPNGCIRTDLISPVESDDVIVKATVFPDSSESRRYFTAYSQATWGEGMVNKTAALENAETSAVGRALGFMGIGVIESIASADEINKAHSQPARYAAKPVADPVTGEVETCKSCGSQMGISKAGKKYCLKKCWLKTETQEDRSNAAIKRSEESEHIPLDDGFNF